MAIQIFPVPTSSGLSAAQSLTATAAKTLYYADTTLAVGIYTITCTSSTIARVEFFNGDTVIGLATTVSGSVAFNLATAATRVYIWTNTGTDITVNIQKTGDALTPTAPSGTLDTLTTSSAYTTTGKLYVIAIGGGAAGNGLITYNPGGSGGGGGGMYEGFLTTSNTTNYTIGAQGNGNAGPGNAAVGNSGGATSFGNVFVANGGVIAAGGGTAGTPGGPGPGTSVSPIGSFAKDGSYGGGSGGGSGIGTGGTSNSNNNGEPSDGGNASGFGAGGGGAGAGGNNQFGNAWYGKRGGSGAPGVIYVLRGI
jgi:hypothetical protein